MNNAKPDWFDPKHPGTLLGSAVAAPGAWLRLLLPALGGLVLDLWSKHYAAQVLADQHDVVVWRRVLVFTFSENAGAVFGMGKGHVLLFILFSILALGVIAGFFVRSERRQYVVHVALGLIIAGAMGNLYDRMVYGRVRDFILLLQQLWPFIFNIADVCLCIGVPLLMLCWIFQRDPADPPKETSHGS